MFFFIAFCALIASIHAENIYGDSSMYSFDIPGQPVCTGEADVGHYSPCSLYYPEYGPDHPSTYCAHEYVACCCAHCMECIDPSDTEEPTVEPSPEPTFVPTTEPTLENDYCFTSACGCPGSFQEAWCTEENAALSHADNSYCHLSEDACGSCMGTWCPPTTLEPTAQPTLATLEPTQATSEPTQATSEPTQATLEPTTLEPTAQPTLATLEPTQATSEPTVEPTSAIDEGLEVIPTEAAAPANVQGSSGVSVSVEILLAFVFISFWILCCGGFWVYYKSTKNKKEQEKYKEYIPERKVSKTLDAHIQKISITVGNECSIAEPDNDTCINMNELAAEGTGTTPGFETATPGEYATPGEGFADTERSRTRSAEPYLQTDRPRNETVSTVASMGPLHDSYFNDDEDSTSMDLYEDTFAKVEEGFAPSGQPQMNEGFAPSGQPPKFASPRMSEGGMVTGFDAQQMMRNNVVDKGFDKFDRSYNKKQKMMDPQLSPIQSGSPFYQQQQKKKSLFGDEAMDRALDIPIAASVYQDSSYQQQSKMIESESVMEQVPNHAAIDIPQVGGIGNLYPEDSDIGNLSEDEFNLYSY